MLPHHELDPATFGQAASELASRDPDLGLGVGGVKLVSRLEFGSGAVALRYEPRK
jgi:hypothetical protein